MPAAVARRTHHDTPKWAADILGDNPGPAEFDRVHDHGEARKLSRDTDPNSIDDPGVRNAFIEQLHDDFDADEKASRASNASRPTRGNGSPTGTTYRGSRLLAHARVGAASFGSAVFGLVVYAIGVNFVRGGGSQVKRWMSAKFTNGGGQLP